jgi:hypothetical protein
MSSRRHVPQVPGVPVTKNIRSGGLVHQDCPDSVWPLTYRYDLRCGARAWKSRAKREAFRKKYSQIWVMKPLLALRGVGTLTSAPITCLICLCDPELGPS